jgi:hypothetical protein
VSLELQKRGDKICPFLRIVIHRDKLKHFFFARKTVSSKIQKMLAGSEEKPSGCKGKSDERGGMVLT